MDVIRRYLSKPESPATLHEWRKPGVLTHSVALEALAAGKEWPIVIEDGATNTTTVPATYEGLLAFICSWDTLLLDEEMKGFKAVVNQMVTLDPRAQPRERLRRQQIARNREHLKEDHPEEYDKLQGWRV